MRDCLRTRSMDGLCRRMARRWCVACIAVLLTAAGGIATEAVPVGKSDFVFVDEKGNAAKPMRVWVYRPETFAAQSPIVFVMHGTLRNGETYREPWVTLADAPGALVVVPEFGLEDYRDPRTYQFGNMRT